MPCYHAEHNHVSDLFRPRLQTPTLVGGHEPKPSRLQQLTTLGMMAPERMSTVTSDPKRCIAWASSRPMGPPPITTCVVNQVHPSRMGHGTLSRVRIACASLSWVDMISRLFSNSFLPHKNSSGTSTNTAERAEPSRPTPHPHRVCFRRFFSRETTYEEEHHHLQPDYLKKNSTVYTPFP